MSNTCVLGNLVQKTAPRRRDFYEGQGARISIMAKAKVPLRRIRLCTTEQSLTQPTCQRGGPYVFERISTGQICIRRLPPETAANVDRASAQLRFGPQRWRAVQRPSLGSQTAKILVNSHTVVLVAR